MYTVYLICLVLPRLSYVPRRFGRFKGLRGQSESGVKSRERTLFSPEPWPNCHALFNAASCSHVEEVNFPQKDQPPSFLGCQGNRSQPAFLHPIYELAASQIFAFL